jgi:SAM-dependent methyltransferase
LRHRLLDLLACPECGRFPLELTALETESDPRPDVKGTRCSAWCAFQQEEATRRPRPCAECYGVEITQGILHCNGCSGEYPIIDGIPRFTPDADADYPEFFRRFGSRFRNAKRVDVAAFNDLHIETKKSFGFQWLRYRVTDHQENRDHFFRRTATTPETIGKQLFFEAGCGMGRYLKVIGDEPTAEAVGLDLSLAVNRARAENRHNPFIHVVQGNIMQLPLRPRTFDHVYSIGVLHHTPDTKAAFQSIVKLAKPGGRVSIWVYHVWRHSDVSGFKAVHATVKGWVTDGLRVITTRLPFPVLNALCQLAAPVGWVQRRIMNSPQPFRTLLSPFTLVNCSIHPEAKVRILDTFDWYSPRYQWKHTVPEVQGWFRDAGLVDITTDGFPVSVRGRQPAKGVELKADRVDAGAPASNG